MKSQRHSHDLGLRIYRTLLRLYPAPFLREYEAEMLICFRDARHDLSDNTGARCLFWISLLGDLIRSAFKENSQHLFRLMNPKPGHSNALLRFVKTYPLRAGGIILSLASATLLSIKMPQLDFTKTGYLMAMAQVTVLCLIMLISGFIIDVGNMCLKKVKRQVIVHTSALHFIGIIAMVVATWRLQNFDLTVEQLLPVVLQINIFAMMWFQLVSLNDIRLMHREIAEFEGTDS